MYEISKNVPLPVEKVKHNYPHEQLQVGESFLVPGGNMNVLCNYNRIKGKRLERKFGKVDFHGLRIDIRCVILICKRQFR